MVLNVKQFLAQVKRKNSTCVYFFEGHDPIDHTDKRHRPFEKMKLETPALLQKELKEFATMYPHPFSCLIHTTDNCILTKGFFMKVDLSDIEITPAEVVPVLNAPVSPAVQETAEKMEARIFAKLAAATKQKTTEKELEIANKKLEKQDQVSEKLSMVVYQLLNQFMGETEEVPAMQGTAGEAEVDFEKVKDAFNFLRGKLGDETIVKLASKIEANEGLVNFVKNFVK